MTAQFPGGVYTPRTKENRSGVVYDAEQTKRIYAEDIKKLDEEIVAVEDMLLPVADFEGQAGKFIKVNDEEDALEFGEGGGGGGGVVFKSVSVSLTAAQIKSLFDTPIEIVPGVPDKILVPLMLLSKKTYVSPQYLLGGTLTLFEETTGETFSSSIYTNAQMRDANSYIRSTIAFANNLNRLGGSGKGIFLNTDGQNFTTGNSTLDLTLIYYESALV